MKISRRLIGAAATASLWIFAAPASFAGAVNPAIEYPHEFGVEAGERWREKLGLNPEQVRKFTLLEKDKEARLKPLRELMRNCLVQLQAQLAENASETDISDLLKQLIQIRKAIDDRADRFDASRAAFLSPSQHARLVVWNTLGGLDGPAARRLEAAASSERREEEHEK